MFQRNKRYAHRSMLDIEVLVVSDVSDYGDEVFMRVKYWNKRSKIFQPDPVSTDNVLVKKNRFDDWMLCE